MKVGERVRACQTLFGKIILVVFLSLQSLIHWVIVLDSPLSAIPKKFLKFL